MKKLLFIMLLISVPAVAQDIRFAWDAYPESAALCAASGGFHLYASKQSNNYTAPAATFACDVTQGSIPKPGLGKYYFVLTAFTPEIESDHSNEVNTTIKPNPPKLNTVEQIASVIKGGVVKVAGLFAGKKNLRIIE